MPRFNVNKQAPTKTVTQSAPKANYNPFTDEPIKPTKKGALTNIDPNFNPFADMDSEIEPPVQAKTFEDSNHIESVAYQALSQGNNFKVDGIMPEIVVPELTKEQANKKLADMVQELHEQIKTIQSFADKHGLSFGLDVEYGMGGYYEQGKWYPISQSC